ncbi:MAG: arylsulfatase [Rhizobiales bacterium]|nr:arylsulfatase [Hyphomicrobiales bacterium]
MRAGNLHAVAANFPIRAVILQSAAALAALVLVSAPAGAQQVTGTPGAPDATTTIDGRYLPNPPPPFGGEINLNAAQSRPFWPPRIVPPAGAPNVLLIMTDDVGFGAPSTFGGVIPTPALDRIAASGLRYTQFHSTALCSPTRAALITGRNHHSVGFGQISEMATGYPGYDSIIGPESATIGEILRENGYATSWFGKDHNTPAFEASQAGPFDQWPGGMGFDYFYGFVGGDTSQWQPNLFRNTTAIYPYLGHPGWNLTTAMADEAINHSKMLNEVDPSKPFFVYYVPGGTHAPHHPTPEWIDRISAMHLFDQGWNALRDQIFANQKKLGVVPADAQLTPWPSDRLKNWDQLSADEKKMFIRQADVYAAYLAYTDHEIGRVIQAVQDAGKLDNTLIIYISGDNGASPEGTLNGLYSEFAVLNGIHPTVAENMKFYDVWGTNETYPHYAVPWAWAWATPYQWTKEVASHFGGTRNGMAMMWPAKIKDKGGIRTQFHHVIDIVPTILEAAGVPQPVMVNGITQKPIEGVSMEYSWDAPKAQSRRDTQYFEMFGSRAIYHDGWIASAPPVIAPWDPSLTPPPTNVMNGFKWELYDLNKDWTQAKDLAAAMPDKLRDMQQLFTMEATKYNVFPLDDRTLPRFIGPKPNYNPGRTEYVYRGVTTNVPFPGVNGAPNLLNKSYTITAEIDVPEGGAQGVLVTDGGHFSGYGFYLLDGVPTFTWNLLQAEMVKWKGKDALAPGKHTLEFDWNYAGPGLGKGGTGTLKVDGTAVDTRDMPHSLPVDIGWVETFNVGTDTGTAVDEKDYQVPFAFNGTIDKLTVKVGPEDLTPEEREMIYGTMRARQ